MKNILPFFAACALFAGVACSTYTSTTDPNDQGSGTALSEEVTSTSGSETENHAASSTASTETSEAVAPAAEAPATPAAPSEEAAH